MGQDYINNPSTNDQVFLIPGRNQGRESNVGVATAIAVAIDVDVDAEVRKRVERKTRGRATCPNFSTRRVLKEGSLVISVITLASFRKTDYAQWLSLIHI